MSDEELEDTTCPQLPENNEESQVKELTEPGSNGICTSSGNYYSLSPFTIYLSVIFNLSKLPFLHFNKNLNQHTDLYMPSTSGKLKATPIYST